MGSTETSDSTNHNAKYKCNSNTCGFVKQAPDFSLYRMVKKYLQCLNITMHFKLYIFNYEIQEHSLLLQVLTAILNQLVSIDILCIGMRTHYQFNMITD